MYGLCQRHCKTWIDTRFPSLQHLHTNTPDLRQVRGVGAGAQALHAANSPWRGEAVCRLLRPDGGADECCHRLDHTGTDLCGHLWRFQLHLRLRHRTSDLRRLDWRPGAPNLAPTGTAILRCGHQPRRSGQPSWLWCYRHNRARCRLRQRSLAWVYLGLYRWAMLSHLCPNLCH